MLGPTIIGLLAACIAFIPKFLHSRFPSLDGYTPVAVLGIGAFSIFLQKILLFRKAESSNYDGLVDLFLTIHSPLSFSSATRWMMRGSQTFLLCLFGGGAGSEGAVMEWLLALQVKLGGRASRWFEQRRRTDCAMSIAAGIAAAFSAVLFPIELGIGGRSIASSVSAMAAYLSIRFLMSQFSIEIFDVSGVLSGFHFNSWKIALEFGVIGICGGLLSGGMICFFTYVQTSLRSLFQTQVWMKTLAGAGVLSLVFFIFRKIPFSTHGLLEQVLWLHYSLGEVVLLWIAIAISLAFVTTSFGTLGVFWPIFTLGGLFGFCINYWFLRDLTNCGAAAGVVGSAALLGSILGTPLAASVLAFELTQNLQLVLPCMMASFLALWVRKKVHPKSWIEVHLEDRDCTLVSGRSEKILNSILVRDAMATDFDLIHEQEPLSDLHSKVLSFRYPFLPVVNSQGVFKGLLTVDRIEECWLAESSVPQTAATPLSKLLEAKDLIYRFGVRLGMQSEPAKAHDTLSCVIGRFENALCVPVLGDGGKVLGLLFSFQIRQAYEREMARQSALGMRKPCR